MEPGGRLDLRLPHCDRGCRLRSPTPRLPAPGIASPCSGGRPARGRNAGPSGTHPPDAAVRGLETGLRGPKKHPDPTPQRPPGPSGSAGRWRRRGPPPRARGHPVPREVASRVPQLGHRPPPTPPPPASEKRRPAPPRSRPRPAPPLPLRPPPRPAPAANPNSGSCCARPCVIAAPPSPARPPARPGPAPPSDAAAGGRLPRGVRAAALHGVTAHQPQAPRPARGACGGEWPPVAAPPPPGRLGRPEPAPSPPPGAPARDRGPAAGVPFTAEGHLPPRGPAPSLRGAAGTRPPPQLALPAVCVGGGPGALGAREQLVNPRGIRGLWIFLRSVFSMSQLRNGEAEKLCQGHRGRWPRRARRAVPAGSRGGGRQGRGPSRQDPPRRLGTGRRPVRVTERAFARGIQEVTHLGGNRPEPGGLAVLARRRWDASVPSTLLVWRSSARGRLMADSVPCSAVISESDGRAHRPASALGMKEVWMGLVRFLGKLVSSEVPFLQVSAPSFR